MVDPSRAYYEQAFRSNFAWKTGNEFQDFFSEIMEKCHPGDFVRIRPWGKFGDRKNDGYLASERMLFQVYAPNEISASNAIAKIDEDFYGALPYWEAYFDKWTFVHNSRQGIAPDILQKLLLLDSSHEAVKIGQWGFEELRRKIFELQGDDLAALLGPAPSNKDMSQIGFEDLSVVLTTIAVQTSSSLQEIRPVPSDKLYSNALSENVETLLISGMRKADLVDRFFKQWHDPTFGDSIAVAFRQKYIALRDSGFQPDKIFTELQVFAGGLQRRDAGHEAAVLAVLAYFFEQCDIFESARVKATQ